MRNALIHGSGLIGGYLLDHFGRAAGPKGMWRYDRILEYYSTCGYDGAFAYYGVVHNYTAHTDERIVLYLRTVYHHIMPDGYIVANLNGRLLVKGVQHTAILYIDIIANADAIDITAHHGIEPYTAIIAHYYVAHHTSSLCEE